MSYMKHRYSDVDSFLFQSSTMATRLLVLLCLTGHVFAKKPPDVNCIIVHLKYVNCLWNANGTPDVNYTFYGWFSNEGDRRECTTYLSENGINIGCNHVYQQKIDKWKTFHTKLETGDKRQAKEHDLRDQVKLYPPTNLTVKVGSDNNLWFYWNQSYSPCVKSQVRYRINNKTWTDDIPVSEGKENYCINLPVSSSQYELQVRSQISNTCQESKLWSDWCEPVVWGSNNSTDTNKMESSMSVWTPVMYVLGALTLILMVMMLLHHERVRIILMPVVPEPVLKVDWQQLPKGLKESFNPSYNEPACPVREYSLVSQSSSDSSDSSTSSVTTDQTDCSVFMPGDEPDLSTQCSSSTSTVSITSEEAEQVSV